MNQLKVQYLIFFLASILILIGCQDHNEDPMYSGSSSCMECHQKFYDLWATSYHGLAMQGVDSTFIADQLTFSQTTVNIREAAFTVLKRNDSLIMQENLEGQLNEYPAIHALGGKYIYYFLTPFPKGRLQVLPLAYDVRSNQWYNNPASAVRHFVDSPGDEELDWRHFAFTFNSSCHSCHVSQLENNYDLTTGEYVTTWKEAGINCETCHGPSQEHVLVCQNAKKGEVPEDLKIIMTSRFTHEQNNSSCAPCHAKMRTLTTSYPPGERFYDHFDLVTLEDPDFYADGRDLGENYTMTTWSLSSCAASGSLDCVHCHTSSGRYRFATENHNSACLPCHQENVENIYHHSHHPQGSENLTCVSCHMPKTTFARMDRSDHSMRPPMPEASLAFGSPNACNICHSEESVEWSIAWVEKWTDRGYQDETLRNGRLLTDARSGTWKYLDEILMGLINNEFDEVYTNSFIRLLSGQSSEFKWPAILPHTQNKSPLVRSSAITLLGQYPSNETKQILLNALRDDYRLVRRAATSGLAGFPPSAFSPAEKEYLAPHMTEYEQAFLARPDDWAAHYNLGNYYQNQQRYEDAVKAYETSLQIFPEALAPMINQSFTYNLLNKKELALQKLYQALSIDPENEAANLNFAMLMGELGRLEEAENALRKVALMNPQSPQAAYNLSVILSERNPDEALEWGRKAYELNPDEPKYAYSFGFYLNKSGNQKAAEKILVETIASFPSYADAVLLLGSIYEKSSRKNAALQIYEKALKEGNLEQEDLQRLNQTYSLLKSDTDE